MQGGKRVEKTLILLLVISAQKSAEVQSMYAVCVTVYFSAELKCLNSLE